MPAVEFTMSSPPCGPGTTMGVLYDRTPLGRSVFQSRLPVRASSANRYDAVSW